MKKKTSHHKFVDIRTDIYECLAKDLPNVTVTIKTKDGQNYVFYIPASSIVPLVKGKNVMVIPNSIIASRAKHDFGITWDSYGRIF